MRTLALLSFLAQIVFAQAERTACALPAGIESEYRLLPSMSNLSLSWEERYGPWRELAKRYPNNWPLQFALQQPILMHGELGREWDLAIEHYRALPDRLLGELLEGRLLTQLQRKKSREQIDHVLGLAQDSPWPHLAMLEWAADRRKGDRALAKNEFVSFRRMCPGDRRVFQYLSTVRDPEELNRQIHALREAIEASKMRGLDEEDLEMLRTAWEFERITYSQDRFEEFRTAVRSDLEFLREHPNYDSGLWVYLVESGYAQVLKETSVIKSIQDETLQHAPNGNAAYNIEQERWRQSHPEPAPAAAEPHGPIHELDRSAMDAYGGRRNTFTFSLVERFWGKPYAAEDALSLLSQPELPPETFKRLADFVLSSAERFPDQGTSSLPIQFQVAEAYNSRKIRLEQVPGLIERGLGQMEIERKYERDSDAFDEGTRRNIEESISDNKRRAQEILIEQAIATGEKERARGLLDEYRRDIEESRATDSGVSTAKWRGYEIEYRRLAQKAGVNVPPESDVPFTRSQEDDRFPVPRFEAKDLSGRTWSSDSLLGKVTYVGTWCVSCGGCAQGVQQLYERWKNRSDRAVLTISVDQNPAITESFMKENGFNFPVIFGLDAAEKILRISGWPLQSLVDSRGRRVRLHPPRASEATIAKIEEMADNIAATQ